MKVAIQAIAPDELSRLISSAFHETMNADEFIKLRQCLDITTDLRIGLHNGELVCIWGLVPPTLMSDQVYLWLYTTPALAGNEFLFVRHSQVAIENILKSYSRIVGHTEANNAQAIRWLKWLGAEFEPSEGRLLTFSIRKP